MELRDSRWRKARRPRRASSFPETAFEASDAAEEADAFEPFEWKLVRSIAVAKRSLFSANFARRLLAIGKALFPREEASFPEGPVAAKFAETSAFSQKCFARFEGEFFLSSTGDAGEPPSAIA